MSYIREVLEKYKTYSEKPSEKVFKLVEDFLDRVENKGVDTEDWEMGITSNNMIEIEYGDDYHGYVNICFTPEGSIDYTFKNSEERNIDLEKVSNKVIHSDKSFRHHK